LENRRPLEDVHALVTRAQAGDRTAMDALFARYMDELARAIRPRLGPALREHFETQDVVISALGDAYARLDSFQLMAEQGFRNWLLCIASRNVAAKADRIGALKRGAARRLQAPTDGDDPLEAQPTPDPTPTQVAQAREAAERIDRAWTLLSLEDQAILKMAREEKPMAQIAEAFRCSPAAASMRLVRARRALAKFYDPRPES
jgi:RNA polymerase sigma factor (sigma-70 family)